MAYESKQSGDVHKSKTMQYNYQHFFRHDPMDRAKAYQYPPQPRKKARPTRYAPYPAIPDVPGDSISINANVPKNQPYFQSNRMFELTAKSTTNKFSSPLKPKTPSTKQCARNHAKSFKTELGSSYYAHLSNMHAYTRPINDSQSRTSAIRPINYLESAHTSRSHLPRSEGNTLNIHMPIPVSASLPLVLSIGKYDDDAVSEFPSLPSTSLGLQATSISYTTDFRYPQSPTSASSSRHLHARNTSFRMTDFRRLVANSQSSSISAHQSNGPAMSFTPATTSFGSTVPIYHRKEQTQQSKVINMSRLANNARSGHIGSASAPSSMPVPSVPVTSMPVPSMPVPSASISTRTRPIASVSHATLIALTEPFLLSWCLPYGPTLSSN